MDDGLGPDEGSGGVVKAGDEAVDVLHQLADAAERGAWFSILDGKSLKGAHPDN